MRISRRQKMSRFSRANRARFRSTSRLWLAVIAMLSLLVAIAPSSDASPPIRQTVDVIRIDNGATEGTATLLRTDSGIHMRMKTTVAGLMYDLPFNPPPIDVGASWTVGDATTNWFVVFSNPAGCSGPCGEDDVIDGIFDVTGSGGPAKVSVHYAAGHVAGNGSWHSAGSLQEGDTSGMLFGVPLIDAKTAEVHVIARSHGPASDLLPGELGYALNSVDGGCETNICGDAQAAIFNPPS